MNAQEYEIIEPIENDSEDDEEEEDDDEKEEEEVYVDALQISKVDLEKKDKEEDEEDEDELFPDSDRKNPFEVRLTLPHLIASDPSPLLDPWKDLPIEFIWQSSRALPASTPLLFSQDLWAIEPFSSPPSTSETCSCDVDFSRTLSFDTLSKLSRRESSKGSLTLKTPIIAGEWVVNQYHLLHLTHQVIWKHVGQSSKFRTENAKVRIQGNLVKEDEFEVEVEVKIVRQNVKRNVDSIVAGKTKDFKENVGEAIRLGEREGQVMYLHALTEGGSVGSIRIWKRERMGGEEEKKGEEYVMLYVTEDLQDLKKEKRKRVLGRSRPFLVPFLK